MLEDLKAAVAAEHSVVQSAITLIQGLADKIANLSPNQADIDALAAAVRKDATDLGAKVSANTPSAPDASAPAPTV